MATLAAGSSISFQVGFGQSVRIQTSHNVSGKIRFVTLNAESPPANSSSRSFGPLATDQTFGPWSQPGTVSIDCDQSSINSITYTVIYGGTPANPAPVVLGGVDYKDNGTNLFQQQLRPRKKIASFGNSLSSLNGGQFQQINSRVMLISSNVGYTQQSVINQIQALYGVPFDYCRSHGNGNIETVTNTASMDECGIFGYSGSTVSLSSQCMTKWVGRFCQSLIDAPDLIFFWPFQNDINSNSIITAAQTQDAIVGASTCINVMKAYFPNAEIVLWNDYVAQTVPTAAQVTAFNTVENWVQNTAPTLWDGILPMTRQGRSADLTSLYNVTGYTTDNVHYSRRGAILEARKFWSLYGKKFTGKLFNALSNEFYDGITATKSDDLVQSGDFSKATGVFSVGGAGALADQLITGTNASGAQGIFAYTDAGVQIQFTPQVVGTGNSGSLIEIAAFGSSPTTPTASNNAKVGAGFWVRGTPDVVPEAQPFMGFAVFKVVDPSNLCDLAIQLNAYNGATQLDWNGIGGAFAYQFGTSGTTDDVKQDAAIGGLSNYFVAGDYIYLTTPPIQPPSTTLGHSQGVNPTNYRMYFKAFINAGTPVGFGGATPKLQIIRAGIIPISPNRLVGLATANATPLTYRNRSKGLQQLIISGGTGVTVTIAGDYSALNTTANAFTAGAGQLIVRPGDTVVINNTTAPTVAVHQLT